MGVFEGLAVGHAGGAGDGQQRGRDGYLQDGGLVAASMDHFDVFDRLERLDAEMDVEELVEGAAQRELQQAGEPVCRQAGAFQGDRTAVGQPDPDHVQDVCCLRQVQSGAGCLVGPDQGRADHPGAGRDALLTQQGRDADDAGQVPVDFGMRDERAAAPTRDPAYDARSFHGRQRLADRGAAHAERAGQLAFTAELRAGFQGTGPDLVQQPAPGVLAGPADGVRVAHRFCRADIDSGSTCPPSTTSVWPVI